MGDATAGLTILDQLGEVVPHLRVLRLAWGSPLRAAGVVPGDWIIGVDDVPLKATADYAPGERERLPGNYQEAQGFEMARLKPGDPLKPTIRRRQLGGSGWVIATSTGDHCRRCCRREGRSVLAFARVDLTRRFELRLSSTLTQPKSKWRHP